MIELKRGKLYVFRYHTDEPNGRGVPLYSEFWTYLGYSASSSPIPKTIGSVFNGDVVIGLETGEKDPDMVRIIHGDLIGWARGYLEEVPSDDDEG